MVRKSEVMMQAETGAAAAGDEEPVKRKVANHRLVNAAGETVENEEEATGIGYQVVGSQAEFIWQSGGTAGDALTMLAVFGAKTLATNESSAARNRKEDPADSDGQMEAVKERFALINTGKWVDRSRDGVGTKIDLDQLAGAIVDVAQAAGKTADYAALRQKLEEDPNFKKVVQQVAAIKSAYAKRVGRVEKTLDEALGDLLGA